MLSAMVTGWSCFPEAGGVVPVFGQFHAPAVAPGELDALLAGGWRHFGTDFFRYNLAVHGGVVTGVLSLRVRAADFVPTKSQRRVARRNADLETRFVPAAHGAEYDTLFARHRERFRDNRPDSLRDFLSAQPARVPCECVAVEVREGGRLRAVSFLDLGAESASSVYAVFDPDFASRSLGIFTILREIEHARACGKRFYYLGYAYTVPSPYDYKKRMPALEAYDWEHGWKPLSPGFTWARELPAG